MTKVIPPRESMPSEAAVLRRSKPTFLRSSVLRAAVMRAASLLMLYRAGQSWLIIFGADKIDFLALPLQQQILIGAFAVISTIAGVGLWLLAIWGVALWIVCLGMEIAPLTRTTPLAQLPQTLWNDPFLTASLALFLLFLVAAALFTSDQGRNQ
jgi:hypothetical protein